VKPPVLLTLEAYCPPALQLPAEAHGTELTTASPPLLGGRSAGTSPEVVSAQLRALGVPSVQVKYLGQNRKGCRRADVEAAATGAGDAATG
jgi:hypothetical protein